MGMLDRPADAEQVGRMLEVEESPALLRWRGAGRSDSTRGSAGADCYCGQRRRLSVMITRGVSC